MCAASPSRCRKDASSPVRRSPFVAISGPFLSLAVPVAVDYVAERALARGARGIKLHPRAEQFRLADKRLDGVYALANERGLPVITHAGRGIPALGRDALEITGRYPGLKLILAHSGVSDLSWIWRHAADHPNLFFDTAW